MAARLRHLTFSAAAVVLLALAVSVASVAVGTAVDAGTATTAGAQCAPRLVVSKTSGLAAAGETLTVSGSCYDVNKGIYVAFCVVPPAGAAPSPCGGGVDMSGANGLSHWISSNPPPYGVGLATPYGPGGSFTVTMPPSATLNADVDCRRVRCAIVSRNDHARGSDRGQDVIIPVTFAAAPTPTTAPPPPAFVPPPTEAPTTTAAPETTTTVAPDATTTTEAASAESVAAAAGETEELDVAAASSAGSDSSSTPIVVGLALVVVVAVAGGTWFMLRRRGATSDVGDDATGGPV